MTVSGAIYRVAVLFVKKQNLCQWHCFQVCVIWYIHTLYKFILLNFAGLARWLVANSKLLRIEKVFGVQAVFYKFNNVHFGTIQVLVTNLNGHEYTEYMPDDLCCC